MQWYVHRGEAFAFLRELGDASIDALITDPPYSSGGQFRGDRAGSATTGIAALLEGRSFVGCELSDEYHAIATARLQGVA